MSAKHEDSGAATTNDIRRPPPKAWRILFWLMLLGAFGLVMLFVGARFGGRIHATLGQMWHDIVGGEEAQEEVASGSYYTCGMHPWVILPAPGLCPICHMDLTPLDPAKFSGEITIDPVLAQNIGVRTGVVERGPVVSTIRTVGKIDYDETRVVDVNLRVSGWIEALHVDYLGATVTEGQPLFELYSPELYSAQQDYLLARQQQAPPDLPFVPRIGPDAASSLAAARTRLSFFGIDDAQIAALEAAGVPQRTMTIRSPGDGTVIQKMAVAGMRVDPGMKMYRIADLGRVWVTVTVYESQLPFVAVGQPAVMTLPYVVGQRFEGAVTYVYPWVDDKTRQVNVRLEFDSHDGALKPGMLANVELRRELLEPRTLVSRSAVIDTGARQVAIVSLGGGRFEPRELRLGVDAAGDRVEVLEGLQPGEQVVVSGQFLLDSESKLREGLARMLRGGLVGDEQAAAGPELQVMPPALGDALVAVVEPYLRIGDALASDSTATLAGTASSLSAAASALLATAVPDDEHFWHRHRQAEDLRGRADELAKAQEIAAARSLFADISLDLAALLRVTGVPLQLDRELHELRCPMYRENEGGAYWLQQGQEVHNPYFGSMMLNCSDQRKVLPDAKGDATMVDVGAAVDALVASYLQASAKLAADSTEGLDATWGDVQRQATKLRAAPPAIAKLAAQVAAAVPGPATDIEAIRTAFGALSQATIALVTAAPASRPLEQAYCPMAKAAWLQVDKEIVNPYMGSRMLGCGSVQATLPARPAGGQGR
ncbi:MAG: efflux RND transporter periplasmic adaptor subunit [Planctomycetes bacterium]|nr:efflux RND transporter periplasmic adaptor subunit [Planctomycetota bacterium]